MGNVPACKQHMSGKTYQLSDWDIQQKNVVDFPQGRTESCAKEAFQLLSQHKIPCLQVFEQTLAAAAVLLESQPNLVELQLEQDEQLIVVGDLHGCFQALMKLFQQLYGFPGDYVGGKRLVYLFNGDFVDRGGSGFQVLFSLALFKLHAPNAVHLNRGNHESEEISLENAACTMYRFVEELFDKFQNFQEVMKARPGILRFFASLPLAHTVGKTLICHAGTPVQFRLAELNAARPRRFEVANLDANRGNQRIWKEFVWSYDRTWAQAQFLRNNNLQNLVCSHTSVPFHFITLYDPQNNFIKIIQNQESFEQFVQEKSGGETAIVEVFTSPTNFSDTFVLEWRGDETRAWKFVKVFAKGEIQFVEPPKMQTTK